MLRTNNEILKDGLLTAGFPLTSQYVDGYVGLARKLSVKYGSPELADDFIQVTLMTACLYEPKYKRSEASIYSYCVKPVMSAIKKEFGKQHTNTKVYKTISAAIQKFTETYDLYPSIEDLVKDTGLTHTLILGIYFDRQLQVQVEDVREIDFNNPFAASDDEWVHEHLQALPEQEQRLIDLVYFKEYSIRNAATSIGVSTQQATKLLAEALTTLRDNINTQGM